MCTFVILRRPDDPWPVIIAANRDEMADRPSSPPARHWPERPGTIAGRDDLAGGSWLGLNDDGVVAGIMNRMNTLGPQAGKRSRGELVLEALDHADARESTAALAELDGRAYRPFNMVVADNRDAFWLRHTGRNSGIVEVRPLPAGLSIITAQDRNDIEGSERIRGYLPRFEAALPPQPGNGDWAAWETLVASRGSGGGIDGMTIELDGGFGTRSSSLIALAEPPGAPVWRYADGPPDRTPYRDVILR
jgi:hypothetical protein